MKPQLEITPTPFLRGPEEALVQRLDVTLTNPGEAAEMALVLQQAEMQHETALGLVPAGESRHEVYFPIAAQPTEAEFLLRIGDKVSTSLRLTRQPPKRWTVHVVQNSHHDLGYTGLPAAILRQHDRWLDEALEHARASDGYPEDARFRMVIEQAWSLEHFLRTAPPPRAAEMLARLREGRFEVNALYANLTTELCSPEELIRALYPSFRLKREHAVPIQSAEHNDITGFSWGLAEALLGAGVRLFIPGLPLYYNWGYAGLESFWDQNAVLPQGGPGAFWWQAPSGGRLLVWDSGSGCGGDSRASLPGLEQKLIQLEEERFAFSTLRWPVTGANSDNSPYRSDYADSVRAWNERWTWPRLVCSTNTRFYADLAREDLSVLPVFRGELPGQDYPVGAMSTAAATGLTRRTHAALSSAETAAAAAGVLRGAEYPGADLEEAWQDMLLHDEHTWGFQFPAGPAGDAARVEKAARAARAAAQAHDVLCKALARLGEPAASGASPVEPHLMVFNSLGEVRSEPVRVPLRALDNAGRVLTPVAAATKAESTLQVTSLPGRDHLILSPDLVAGHFDLIDCSSGRKVAYQIEPIRDAQTPLPHAADRLGLGQGTKRLGLFEVAAGVRLDLVFSADAVPACGWKTYRLKPRSSRPRFPAVLSSARGKIENEFYRLTIDGDGRPSLYDKEAGRELLDPQSPHPLGALVARAPGGEEWISRAGRVRRGSSGPAAASLELDARVRGHPAVRLAFTLHAGLKQLDMALSVLKDGEPLLDAHLAFPFAMTSPRFRYEGVLSALTPAADFLPGAQSDRLTVQNWVKVTDGDLSLLWCPVDAPVASLGRLWDGYVSPAHRCLLPESVHAHRRLGPADFDRGWIYSLLFANNFGTNFAVSQPGTALFRYRLSTSAGDAADEEAAAWGQAAFTPLESAWLPAAPLPVHTSLVRVEGARLLACKRAEDGRGWILRLWNPAQEESRCRLTFPTLRPTAAWLTNLVEENLQPAALIKDSLLLPIPAGACTTLRFNIEEL